MFVFNPILPFTPGFVNAGVQHLTSTGSCATAKHIHPDEKALFDNFFDGLSVKLTGKQARRDNISQ